jgi:hypothetical protein
VKRPIEDVLHQIGQVAAVADDEFAQLRPQRMVRHDAEIATDIGDDGADRAAADLSGDLLGRGQGHPRVEPGRAGSLGGLGGGRGQRSAVGGSTWGRGPGVQLDGCADDPGFEQLGTKEAVCDAREDQGDVGGGGWIAAKRGGELPTVVDEVADEGDEAAGTAGFGGGGGLGGRHEQTRNTNLRRVSRNLFPTVPAGR